MRAFDASIIISELVLIGFRCSSGYFLPVLTIFGYQWLDLEAPKHGARSSRSGCSESRT